MAEIGLRINGQRCRVSAGTTVAAAMLAAGAPCRVSVRGETRTAMCGMGICLECRATVDGVRHRATCQLLCEEGMTVETSK